MGTGLMQWTAAEMVECNRLLRLCILCFWFVLTGNGCELTTPDPSALILVSNFAIRILVIIYIHKKERKLNAPAACQFCLAPSVTFSFLSPSLWRQIYHYQSWYSCARTLCDDVWQSKRGPNGPKKHGLTHPHCPSSHHHDE